MSLDGLGAPDAELPADLPGFAEACDPRKPASTVLGDDLLSDGSATRKVARMQGCTGSAQPSSRGVGRAIGLRIAGVGGDLGRDLVGPADHRIEVRKVAAAVERGAESGPASGYWRR